MTPVTSKEIVVSLAEFRQVCGESPHRKTVALELPRGPWPLGKADGRVLP